MEGLIDGLSGGGDDGGLAVGDVGGVGGVEAGLDVVDVYVNRAIGLREGVETGEGGVFGGVETEGLAVDVAADLGFRIGLAEGAAGQGNQKQCGTQSAKCGVWATSGAMGFQGWDAVVITIFIFHGMMVPNGQGESVTYGRFDTLLCFDESL